MNRHQGLLMIVACAFLCVTASAQDQRFANPPKEARPYVWWHWINGNTSKDGIRKDLEWMNRIGIAGFHQFDAGGAMMQGLPPVVPQTPYLSDAWKENFAYAIHLADSLGMEVGIASAPGWSSTGGPWVEPADAMKKLTWRTLEVKGNGKSQTLTLPEPYKTIGRFQNVSAGIYAPVFEKMSQWYQDIAVVAVRCRRRKRRCRNSALPLLPAEATSPWSSSPTATSTTVRNWRSTRKAPTPGSSTTSPRL